MATYVGIGFSRAPDTIKAAQEAADQAARNLHSSSIDFAIVLNTAHYNPSDFMPIIDNQLKKTRLIGSSTAGIHIDDRVETRGIAILAMYSDDVRFQTSSVDNIHLQNLQAAGAHLAENCLSEYGKDHQKLFLFFADGLIQEISQFISGITKTFSNVLPVIGAGSSDDFQFQKTYQYFNNKVLTFGACGVLFCGRLRVCSSCRHGWRPLGKPRVINQQEGNVINLIDDRPAAQIYQEYFENTTEILRASSLTHLNSRYPLGAPLGKNREYLLRNIIKTLEDDSIVLQDGIPDKKPIHLMIGNKESCLQAADLTALEVKSQLQGRTPKLILIFESLTRFRILGRARDLEIDRIRNILGKDVPIFGMCSFGEISTFSTDKGQETLLQNASIIITAIC